MRYPFETVEAKWRNYWEDNQVYKTNLSDDKEKLYCLVMFIYPSGAKLHCGHWYNYGPTDSYARYKKLKGFNVFEPIGYDAFGLPAENYAIKTGIHPQDSTLTNIEDIRVQLKKMGCMYDWSSEMMTCAPEYYRWNQWLFLQLYKKGLAYRKNAPVNWCSSCNTVLAKEQVDADGGCDRCGTVVEQKQMVQWFFKITAYAEELLDGHNHIQWPEKTKLMQKNWIGKSVGAEVVFQVEGKEEQIKVFTTRPDTLYGVTYVVVAPEHQLVDVVTTPDQAAEVNRYREAAKKLNEIERTSTVKEKTGVFSGSYAINPVNGERVPIWIADYVLVTYGTGCVMAVPAHDERDFAFAKKFDLPIRKVILKAGTEPDSPMDEAFTDEGTMIHSGPFDGVPSEEGIAKVIAYLEEKSFGKGTTNYRLRDWLISRQRYWGTPIPIIHCECCGEVPVPEDQLPVQLPYDVEFKPTGESPLKFNKAFMETTCPQCGKPALRDPDTMDTFVDSSWYYFRYLNPMFNGGMFDTTLTDSWVPVDMYVGGAEHATMHLLYARFIHKFLRDIGLTKADEPFKTLIHQGTITNQGAKMSKSKGNVVNPDEFTSRVGADVFRMYLMFMGPYDQGGDWNDSGITGVERFVHRVYDLFAKHENLYQSAPPPASFSVETLNDAEKAVYRGINAATVKCDADLDAFKFNTVIAALMELLNELGKSLDGCQDTLKTYTLEYFALLLAPVAPALAEECMHVLGRKETIFEHPSFPIADPAALVQDTITVVVQVNGKVRGSLELPASADEEAVKIEARGNARIAKFLDGMTIVKEIYVKGKILNIVVKPKTN